MVEAEAGLGRVRTDEPVAPATLGFSLRLPAILVVLAAGLILRLLLATFPGFGIDVGTFTAWSFSLADAGPWRFYDTDAFTDYAPGYLYVLWFIGEIREFLQDQGIWTMTNKQYEFILKLPSIIADLASAYLLYRLLEGQKQEARVGAALAYLLLPVTWFTGAVWGQVDSLLAFFLLLSLYFIWKDRPVAGGIAFVVAFLVKPQAIAALPFLAFWIMRRFPPRWVPLGEGLPIVVGVILFLAGAGVSVWRYLEDDRGVSLTLALLATALGAILVAVGRLAFQRESSTRQGKGIISQVRSGFLPVPPDVWYAAAGIPAALLVLALLPFFELKPWEFLDQLEFSATYYSYASFHAYNFWSTFAYLEPDRVEYLGISYARWGYVLYAVSMAFVLYSLRRAEGLGALCLGTALCIFVFYMFVTRMHERYLFPMFLPLLAACVILNTSLLWASFVSVTVLHLLNLYHAYAEFNDNHLRIDWIYNWLQDPNFWGLGLTSVEFLSVLMVVTLPPLLAVAYALGDRPKQAAATRPAA
jgi:Gpi18-like mannosyltransferase